MKRTLLILLVIVALSIAGTSPVFAGGDKVRGDEGQGEVNQEWVNLQAPWTP